MKKYLFFDLDGTLTDSATGIVNGVRYTLEKLGDPVPEEAVLRSFVGPLLHESFMRHCGYSEEKARAAVPVFREYYTPVGQYENRPAPGLPELCAELKAQGRVLAIASSKPEEMCVNICERFGFAPSMSVIAGSQPGQDLTKADVIRIAMGRLGLGPADCGDILMIGDREHDVLGARECGIDCVGVEFFGYAAPGELAAAGAAAVARTAEELRQILQEL